MFSKSCDLLEEDIGEGSLWVNIDDSSLIQRSSNVVVS